jgi:type IV pilus assembly protein PilV
MLIEVLVSVLLFSIGVLALVGMQANMTKAQSAAKTRTDAAYLARELVGLMWSDVGNLASYKTDSCANYTRCSAWRAKVLQQLPSANVSVLLDADPAKTGDVTIQIEWTPPEGETHNYTTVTTINAS